MRISVIGGGLCGLVTALLLVDDGHEVVVLERDPQPPTSPAEAWDDWDRSSVRQFHMGHFFLPRFRVEMARELPRVIDAMAAAGALRVNPIDDMPDLITGGRRQDDDRFEAITGRRPMVEAAIATVAASTPGLTIHRGRTVTALTTVPGDGQPVHVSGVIAADEYGQEEIFATDLVVDASGRNSGLARLLRAAGAKAPLDESDDSGFVYYGRAYRSADGSIPPLLGGGLQSYGSISTLTLAADNGTWQLALVASGRDRPMRRARSADVFDRVWSAYPLVAHWLDGEPLSDVEVMANLEDRIRHFVIDGEPVATGLAAVGDSWGCTNPSVGRGASIGLIHAVALRDHIRQARPDDPVGWALGWQQRTAETVEPYVRETLRNDRFRLGEIEAAIEGRSYRTEDPLYRVLRAAEAAATLDPEVLRAWMDYFLMLQPAAEIFADDDLAARVLDLGSELDNNGPGPTRSELLALVGASGANGLD